MIAAGISLQSLNKRFGRYAALDDVSLEIAPGEMIALLGPSGSGKTTLLRVIAGLTAPDAGRVRLGTEDVTSSPAEDRRTGLVFQAYGLFPHMTVAKNIAFSLETRPRGERPGAAEIVAQVQALLALVSLQGQGEQYPAQLSGGQKQRVALARALAAKPRVLLLDEPFGALDAVVRKALRREVRRIHETTGVTTVFVTHDQEEAMEIADRVAVLNAGRIEQVGAPQTLYEQPANAFVCGFVGDCSRFEGASAHGVFVAGQISLPANGLKDGPATAFVRPHQWVRAEDGVELQVMRCRPQGGLMRIDGRLADGQRVDAALAFDQAADLAPGAVIRLTARAAHIFPG
jgi:sulfate transport system ATP-binding protein